MAEDRVERKVTVILATDVVGYSKKIEQNEDQTLETLRACRTIIEGLIAEHHGRVFNTAGDSVLAEFPSAVEAVLLHGMDVLVRNHDGTIRQRKVEHCVCEILRKQVLYDLAGRIFARIARFDRGVGWQLRTGDREF